MATGQGTAVINYGAYPGANESSIVVTGLGTISATSKVEAYIMGDDTTSDHTASDHRYIAALIGITCGTPSTGTGFTIYARSTQKIQGTFALRWVWAD